MNLGGLGARRGKKKGLRKGMGSGNWYTGPGVGRREGRERAASGRGVGRDVDW